jgi:hypothetical protein
MRHLIVLTTTALMVASPVVASAQSELTPSLTNTGKLTHTALREAARLTAPPRANVSSLAQTAPYDNRGWAERHPVWTGAIAGAAAGAVIGFSSCSDRRSCFPIGRSGVAIVGAGWGAGIGSLVGWAIGSAAD